MQFRHPTGFWGHVAGHLMAVTTRPRNAWTLSLVQVRLINAASRLIPHRHGALGRRVERLLASLGVEVIHGVRAKRHEMGVLHLQDGRSIPAAVCIWTLGLQPNPLAARLGLSADSSGRLLTDPHYHVKGFDNLYAIGDCARIVDPVTGQEDEMTCKEAIAQAMRLAAIVKAELAGKSGPAHRSFVPLYCVGLGPEQGLFWVQPVKGWNLFLTGTLCRMIRQFTWDNASLLNARLVKQLAAIGQS